MKVLVVGLNHQIQRADILSSGYEIVTLEQCQKNKFGEALARIIQHHNAEFIGEEARHSVDLVARRVATSLGLQHHNIEMSPDERKSRGIPSDYSEPDSHYPSEQKIAWHRERERFMFDQVISHAGGANNIVVLCGREHIDPLTARFREAGHDVQAYDLNREEWYIENWLDHIVHS